MPKLPQDEPFISSTEFVCLVYSSCFFDTEYHNNMAPINTGTSFYHRIGGIYLRKPEGDLVVVEGNHADQITEKWSQLRDRIGNADVVKTKHLDHLNRSAEFKDTTFALTKSAEDGSERVRVCEVTDKTYGLIRGLVTHRDLDDIANDHDLYDWAELYFLLASEIQPLQPLDRLGNPAAAILSEKIADIFDEKLRHAIPQDKDQWEACGRRYFINRVFGFVDKGLPLQLCLPAFPCKSPNPDKVGGKFPDEAESIALRVLQGFLNEVRKVYEPGAELLIISDGHVFSDCSKSNHKASRARRKLTSSPLLVGVDDGLVTSYNEKLKACYTEHVAPNNADGVKIGFRGLEEILGASEDANACFSSDMLKPFSLEHPVDTKRDDADRCRNMLMALCEVSKTNFRSLIAEHEPNVTSLYRGHIRFVLEDLAQIPACKAKSMNKRKKLAESVSAEMIMVSTKSNTLLPSL